ncbi:hypothetical protein Tco_1054630 [Tanacetum coccineum]|uniref:Uncharacterized protein n=1 Tax=Tanacetum coccineum TaxID=301880 RepID=A0ABQ5GZQ6_9ASTR
MTNIPNWKSELIFVKETLISDAHPALITDFHHGHGTFAYPYPTDPFDEVLWSRLARHTFEAQTFLEPILYLAGLPSTWEHALSNPSILVDGEGMKPGQTPTLFVRRTGQPINVGSPSVDRLKVVDDNNLSSKKKCSITAALEEGATVIKLSATASSSKHESKKRKQEVPRRTSVRGRVPPPPSNAPKGVGKHPRVLARHMGEFGGWFRLSCSCLHYPPLKNGLDSLSLDDLANVYDIHALPLSLFGNMLMNECRVVSHAYSKLKDDVVDASVENSRKMLSGELARLLSSANEAERLGQICRDLEAKRDFLLLNESEEIVALSTKLNIVDLERIELVRDHLPLAVKKLFASKHFNRALGDLQQKASTYGRSQALDEVHGLGDSLDFKDVEDYHPDAKKIYDEVAESFYKLEFPYISLWVEKDGQMLGELAAMDPYVTQKATSQ